MKTDLNFSAKCTTRQKFYSRDTRKLMTMSEHGLTPAHSLPSEPLPMVTGTRDHPYAIQPTPAPLYMPSAAAFRRNEQTYYVLMAIPSATFPYTYDQYRIYQRLSKTMLEYSLKFNYADPRRQSQLIDGFSEYVRSIVP